MDYVDAKYVGLLSSRLEKFKRVKPTLFNFRCPICGDSQRNKNKTRGYLYAIKNNTNFKCHNCGSSMSFNNFLKKLDTEMHKQYTLEKFKSGNTGRGDIQTPEHMFKEVSKPPTFKKIEKLSLPKAEQVEKSHKYLQSRSVRGNFYYAEKFKAFVNTLKPTFDDIRYDEDRIIIPLYRNGNLIGLQGRSIDPNPIKYITVMFDEDAPKIYGLDTIDKNLPVYVVEGPFDSTFLNNSVALCGSDGDVRCLEGSDIIFVYDNEPRNREIVRKIESCIQSGNRVVIWPSGVGEKDINDMVLAGHDVQSMIESNTYKGLEAKLKFNLWKKI